MHFSGYTRLFSAVLAAAFVVSSAVLFSGCGTSGLFDYTSGGARFLLHFPSVSGDCDAVLCDCIRDSEGNITLTVTSPERLAGFTVQIRDGAVSAGAGDTMIPLSADTAASLTALFSALTEQGTPIRSPDGLSTIITTPSGTVTLDEKLLPTEITCGGRTVKIQDWIRVPDIN